MLHSISEAVKLNGTIILRAQTTMYVRQGGKLTKVTKKSINAVSPSTLRTRREAFERKKKTAAFKKWRLHQYRVVQRGRCALCGTPIAGALVTDHIVPLFRGGTSKYSNLQVTHWSCNKKKGVRIN